MVKPRGLWGFDLSFMNKFVSDSMGGAINGKLGFSAIGKNGGGIQALSLTLGPGVEFHEKMDKSSIYLKAGGELLALIPNKPLIFYLNFPVNGKLDMAKTFSLNVGTEIGINILKHGALFLFAGGYIDIPIKSSAELEITALLGIKTLFFIVY